MPFLAVADKTGRINRPGTPTGGVFALAIVKGVLRRGIGPAEVIPIGDMKGNGDKLLPKPVIFAERIQPGFGRWTTAAPFASVKFDERHFFGSARKCLRKGKRANEEGGEHQENFHTHARRDAGDYSGD